MFCKAEHRINSQDYQKYYYAFTRSTSLHDIILSEEKNPTLVHDLHINFAQEIQNHKLDRKAEKALSPSHG